MPGTISAFGGLGKYHDIAVEDEVSAVLQYPDGLMVHFITSTGESPGTNRLELVGENGKLVYENNELVFRHNRSSILAWSESGHRMVSQKFVRHIQGGEPLVAPASEGINQVILTNAMMVSLLGGGGPVNLDQAAEFEGRLARLQAGEPA